MIGLAIRVLGTILSGPMLVLGIIWALQGVGILPGSFMSGDIKWTFIGIPTAIAGGLLVYWLNRGVRT
jgi:hypothetical protein